MLGGGEGSGVRGQRVAAGIARQLPQSLESLPSATGSRKLVANGSSNTINNNTTKQQSHQQPMQ